MFIRNTIFILSICGSTAAADIYDDCDRAIEAGDKAAALLNGKIMLNRRPVPYLELARMKKCLLYATGKEHEYSPTLGRVVSAEMALEAKAEADRLAEEKKADERSWEEAKRRTRVAKIQREQEVFNRLTESCRRLYQKNPDETITNKLCFDLFLSVGLPAD